jgi:hypothetical protein
MNKISKSPNYEVSTSVNWKLGQCYSNAEKNKGYFESKLNKKLKIVYGSLGLNGYFKYGGKHHTDNDYYKNPFVSHAWLEDKDGNVYDFIFSEYGYYAESSGKKVTFPINTLIYGDSKQQLKNQYNLEYIPASIIAQIDIAKNVYCFKNAINAIKAQY